MKIARILLDGYVNSVRLKVYINTLNFHRILLLILNNFFKNIFIKLKKIEILTL